MQAKAAETAPEWKRTDLDIVTVVVGNARVGGTFGSVSNFDLVRLRFGNGIGRKNSPRSIPMAPS
jgi:hypothetical protein